MEPWICKFGAPHARSVRGCRPTRSLPTAPSEYPLLKGRPVVAVEFKHIAMRWTRHLPTVGEAAQARGQTLVGRQRLVGRRSDTCQARTAPGKRGRRSKRRPGPTPPHTHTPPGCRRHPGARGRALGVRRGALLRHRRREPPAAGAPEPRRAPHAHRPRAPPGAGGGARGGGVCCGALAGVQPTQTFMFRDAPHPPPPHTPTPTPTPIPKPPSHQVCFAMFMPTLLRNFLYQPPATGNALADFAMASAARELHVAASLSRGFFWTGAAGWWRAGGGGGGGGLRGARGRWWAVVLPPEGWHSCGARA
jgi:hypothetical protein